MTAQAQENSKTSKEVAATILQQLGGNKFIVMTGAKNFWCDFNKGEVVMGFQIPQNNRARIKGVKITLNANDTYTMEFLKQKRAPSFEVTTVAKHEGVYDDMLQTLFTQETGLYTSL